MVQLMPGPAPGGQQVVSASPSPGATSTTDAPAFAEAVAAALATAAAHANELATTPPPTLDVETVVAALGPSSQRGDPAADLDELLRPDRSAEAGVQTSGPLSQGNPGFTGIPFFPATPPIVATPGETPQVPTPSGTTAVLPLAVAPGGAAAAVPTPTTEGMPAATPGSASATPTVAAVVPGEGATQSSSAGAAAYAPPPVPPGGSGAQPSVSTGGAPASLVAPAPSGLETGTSTDPGSGEPGAGGRGSAGPGAAAPQPIASAAPVAPDVEAPLPPRERGAVDTAGPLPASQQMPAGDVRTPAIGQGTSIEGATAEPLDTTDGPQLVARLTESVERAALRGPRELRIALNPPDLGHLEVRITDGRDGVRVQLNALTHEARDLLQSHLPQLRAGLEARELRVDRLDVQLPDPRTGDPSSQLPQGRDQSQRGEQGADQRPGQGDGSAPRVAPVDLDSGSQLGREATRAARAPAGPASGSLDVRA